MWQSIAPVVNESLLQVDVRIQADLGQVEGNETPVFSASRKEAESAFSLSHAVTPRVVQCAVSMLEVKQCFAFLRACVARSDFQHFECITARAFSSAQRQVVMKYLLSWHNQVVEFYTPYQLVHVRVTTLSAGEDIQCFYSESIADR
jgi:hypothetical protein